MAKSSKAILSFRTSDVLVTKELDSEAIPQFGLVAEEIAKVNPGPDSMRRARQALYHAVRGRKRHAAE